MTIRSPTPARPKGHGVGAEFYGESRHLRQRPGDQHAARVIAHAQRGCHAGHDRVDVLQRPAQLDTEAIGTGVDAEGTTMQDLLYAATQRLVLTRHDGSGQRVFGHFTSQVRSRQHADTCLRRNLLENLAHQRETVRLDALGGADQHLAAQLRGERLQRLAQGAGGQRDENQLASLEGRRQIRGRLHLRQNLDALQVPRVLPLRTDALGLLCVAHPEQDVMPVLGQQVGDRGTETAAAEYRDGLLLCHVVSVMSHSRWQ